MRNAWNGPGVSYFNDSMENKDIIAAAGYAEGIVLDLDDKFGW